MENLAAVPPATPRGQLGEHLPSPLLLLEPALPGAVPPSRGGSSSTQGHWLFPSPPTPPRPGAGVSPVAPDLSQPGSGQSSGYRDSGPHVLQSRGPTAQTLAAARRTPGLALALQHLASVTCTRAPGDVWSSPSVAVSTFHASRSAVASLPELSGPGE